MLTKGFGKNKTHKGEHPPSPEHRLTKASRPSSPTSPPSSPKIVRHQDRVSEKVIYDNPDCDGQNIDYQKIAIDFHGTLGKTTKTKGENGKIHRSIELMPDADIFLENIRNNLKKLVALVPNIKAELGILTNGVEQTVVKELDDVGLLRCEYRPDGLLGKGNLYAARDENVHDPENDDAKFTTFPVGGEEIPCKKEDGYGLVARFLEDASKDPYMAHVNFLYLAATKHRTGEKGSSADTILSSQISDRESQHSAYGTLSLKNIMARLEQRSDLQRESSTYTALTNREDNKEETFINHFLDNFPTIIGKSCDKSYPIIHTEETTLESETAYKDKESGQIIGQAYVATFESLKKLKGEALSTQARKLYSALTVNINQALVSAADKYDKSFVPSSFEEALDNAQREY